MPEPTTASALFSLEGRTALMAEAASDPGQRAQQTLAQAGTGATGAVRRPLAANRACKHLRGM